MSEFWPKATFVFVLLVVVLLVINMALVTGVLPGSEPVAARVTPPEFEYTAVECDAVRLYDSESFARCVDKEYGIVCYASRWGGMDCVEVAK
jgi:hypothetical protein